MTAPTAQSPRHQRPSRLKTFLFGCPYYPEHWSEEDKKNDARLMAEANINVVRMAEFAWDRMEPSRGKFDFSVFDNTIRILGEKGIDTILCTPTATPPRWLTAGHDELMRVDGHGRRMAHGSRQHCCTNNEKFRTESRRITRAMAEHFSANPRVIGWQTDNELFCHISECYCDACARAFQQWLAAKYKDIAALNTGWGTQFWSQTYPGFDSVPLPCIPERPTFPNPGHLLDYYRFISDGAVAFQRQQVEILREANSSWWITHNGLYNHIDYWKFSNDLDFIGVDVYPGFCQKFEDIFYCALSNEEARSVSGSYLVPEQQGGAGGQRPYLHETPRPGQMRLWAYQSIAHGADGILHFRWRTCRFGAEIYWNGILDHDNVPRRRFQEFSQEGGELNRIGRRLLGSTLLIKAGVLTDLDQEEAHTGMGMGLPGPRDQRNAAYKELWRRHTAVGLINASDLFDGLELLAVPSFIVMDEILAAKLKDFVQAGGTVVATARTATRTRANQVFGITPPALLADLFGVTVEEFGKLNAPSLKILTGKSEIPAGGGYEVLGLKGAVALAAWSQYADNGPHAAPGTPAIAVNRYGRGKAIYVGTFIAAENAAALFDIITEQAGLAPLAAADDFVEMTCRRSADQRFLFVLNHYAQPRKVSGLPAGEDILSRQQCRGEVELSPFGVAIIEHR